MQTAQESYELYETFTSLLKTTAPTGATNPLPSPSGVSSTHAVAPSRKRALPDDNASTSSRNGSNHSGQGGYHHGGVSSAARDHMLMPPPLPPHMSTGGAYGSNSPLSSSFIPTVERFHRSATPVAPMAASGGGGSGGSGNGGNMSGPHNSAASFAPQGTYYSHPPHHHHLDNGSGKRGPPLYSNGGSSAPAGGFASASMSGANPSNHTLGQMPGSGVATSHTQGQHRSLQHMGPHRPSQVGTSAVDI